MLRCSEVARLCGTEEIRVGPLSRKLAVRLHLMMCRHCRRYVRELQAIGEAARRFAVGHFGARSSDGDVHGRILESVRRELHRSESTD